MILICLFIYICVCVYACSGIRGLVVTLHDRGDLQVSYLGTDPPTHGFAGLADSAATKELDYERMDEEHRGLLRVIKQASTDTLAEPKEHLELRAQSGNTVSLELDGIFGSGNNNPTLYNPDSDDNCVRDERGLYYEHLVRVYLSYNGNDTLSDVTINIACCPSLKLSSRSLLIESVRGGKTPLMVPVRFRASRSVLPSSLSVSFVASYVTGANEPRTAQCTAQLPLSLVARAVLPLKNCQYMFTLDTNRSPPALTELFQDVLEPAISANPDIGRTAANVLTLVYLGVGSDVTILVSKKSGRYRLQSGAFEALSLVSQLLVDRLTAYYSHIEGGTSSTPFQVSFKELLPLHDYFQVIDKHFEVGELTG